MHATYKMTICGSDIPGDAPEVVPEDLESFE